MIGINRKDIQAILKAGAKALLSLIVSPKGRKSKLCVSFFFLIFNHLA